MPIESKPIIAPRTERLNESLGFLVNALARLMRNELEDRLRDVDLTPTTWSVLMALVEEDGLSQTDLARKILLDGATMTRALDQLEIKHYIVRVRAEGDRRVQTVLLTREGRTAADGAAQIGAEINAFATQDLTEEERAELFKYFFRVMRRMSGLSGDGAFLGD